MKIGYYRYWIEQNMERHRQSMRAFLGSFAQIRSRRFRETFSDGEDNLFLYSIRDHLFLFVITKDRELIKAISENTLSHQDIYRKLDRGERIGFASYVYLGDDFFGIASTLHGPKAKRFGEFINQIFRVIGITDCSFHSAPFEAKTTPMEAIGFHFKSSVRMAIKPHNPLFRSIAAWWGGDGTDVHSIVVEIKPAARTQMSGTFDAVLHKAREAGIESMVVRAKAELEDQMMDFHVVGCGGLSRPIHASGENGICNAILQDVAANGSLQAELETYRGERAYETSGIQAIRRFSDIDHWSGHLGGHRP